MTRAREVHDSFARPTIPLRYLQEMLQAVPAEQGRHLLAQIGLGTLDPSRAQGRVSGASVERLHHQVVRHLDDELYGYFERPVPRGSYLAVLRMACQAPDLRAALAIFTEFYALFDRRPPWRLATRNTQLELVLSPRAGHQRSSLLYTHLMLLSTWRTASWLLGKHIPLAQVELAQRFGDYGTQTRFLFGLEPRLHRSRNSLRFGEYSLEDTIARQPEEAEAWARGTSLPSLLGQPPRGGLELRVRTLLWQVSPVASLTAPEVARELGMSRAVLARRLSARSTNFRALCHEVRRDRAIAWLSEGRSVAEVAAQLGYSEASSFSRAFKRWTGTPPADYRGRPL